MRKNYKIKKTISMKQFISEFDKSLSNYMRDKLLDLEVPSVLTRKENKYRLDLKHVEHTKYPYNTKCEKEYVYGSFLIDEDTLYFCEKCLEDDSVMESPVVNKIYNNLSRQDMFSADGVNAKKIDDTNIDFVVDSVLAVCPDVSPEYLKIVKQMTALAENSTRNTYFNGIYS